jgi:hypothetical protein
VMVPGCLPEVSIPADITVDKVHTFIVDTQGSLSSSILAHHLRSFISGATQAAIAISRCNMFGLLGG